MIPETNAPELLSDDRAVADTEPPPRMPATEPPFGSTLAVAMAALRFTRETASPGDGARCFLVDAPLYLALKSAVEAWTPEWDRDLFARADVKPHTATDYIPAVARAIDAGPTLHDLHAILANAANACARLSRTPGAPVLTADSPREDVIGWLKWNDPNGLYTDDALSAEDVDPLTLEQAWEELARIDLEDAAGVKVPS